MPTCSAISTVLMFIPNEGSYVLAMESDKNLANDAFTKAKRALNEGPDNIVKRLDELKTLGVNVKKEIDCKLRE